jgi:ABC-type phosphate transport system substrate-binding protein
MLRPGPHRLFVLGGVILALLAGARAHAADLVVIGNPAAAPLTREQLADIYLARSNARTPIDQRVDSTIYLEFYRKATGRDSAQIKAIWARILFTGRGVPPKQLTDSEAVKKAVAADPKAVGYIEKSAVDSSVRIVLPLD